MTDEAYFTLHEKPNRQNNRLWLDAPPTEGLEKPYMMRRFWFFVQFPPPKFMDLSIF